LKTLDFQYGHDSDDGFASDALERLLSLAPNLENLVLRFLHNVHVAKIPKLRVQNAYLIGQSLTVWERKLSGDTTTTITTTFNKPEEWKEVLQDVTNVHVCKIIPLTNGHSSLLGWSDFDENFLDNIRSARSDAKITLLRPKSTDFIYDVDPLAE
jgi:hypothetical protein